ncbi:hypothetical protein F5Y16DRAFT_237732 [Xylariaceae sp. FL0255]|nr:hypothetical protein F5Y16DRAFT_237732 [Xylariaceae sp. FL0255]
MASTSIYAPVPETTAYVDGSGVPTGLGGLLTVSTPSSSCSDRWFYDPKTTGYVWSDNRHDSEWALCQPYGATAGAYSPGVCPSGQEFKDVEVFTSENGAGTTNTYYDGRCCNSAFTWYTSTTVYTYDSSVTTSLIRACVSTFNPPVVVSIENSAGPIELSLDSTLTAMGTYLDIFWHESDLSSLPTPLAASLRVAMGLPAYPIPSTSSQTPMPTSAITNGTTGAKLSKGAIAGIAIGVAVAVIIITLMAFFMLRRRWKRTTCRAPEAEKQGPATSIPVQTSSGRFSWITRWRKGVVPESPRPNVPEMDEGENVYKAFGGGEWRSELQGNHSRSPSDSSQVRSELHGHSRNPSNSSQIDPRMSYYSGSTAVGGPPMELEGSIPARQEPIPEVRED